MYNCSVSSSERLNTALLSRILTRNIPSALRLGEGGPGDGCGRCGGMGLDLRWWCSSYWKLCCPCSTHPFPSWRLSVPPLLGSRAPTLSHSGPPSLWNHKALQPNLKQVCFLSLPMHLSSWNLIMNLKEYFKLSSSPYHVPNLPSCSFPWPRLLTFTNKVASSAAHSLGPACTSVPVTLCSLCLILRYWEADYLLPPRHLLIPCPWTTHRMDLRNNILIVSLLIL